MKDVIFRNQKSTVKIGKNRKKEIYNFLKLTFLLLLLFYLFNFVI